MARTRRRWVREQGLLDPAHLVFIDETAVSTNMVRLYGRGPRGERVIDDVPQGTWKTITACLSVLAAKVARLALMAPQSGVAARGRDEADLGPATAHEGQHVVVQQGIVRLHGEAAPAERDYLRPRPTVHASLLASVGVVRGGLVAS